MRILGIVFWFTCLHGQVLTCADNWKPLAQPTSSYLTDMTYDGNQYWAVGDHGLIMSSIDGVQWDRKQTPCFYPLAGIAWNGSRFIAVGRYGTILTSLDGERWVIWPSGTNNHFNGVLAEGSHFYVYGENGMLLTNLFNGWIPLTSNTSQHLTDAILVAGRLFVSGRQGVVIWSDDGVNWTLASTPTTQSLYGLASDGGTIIAVGYDATVIRSVNLGTTWTPESAGGLPTCHYTAAMFSDGQFHILGHNGCHKQSPTGVVWSGVFLGQDFTPAGVATSLTEALVCGRDGRIMQLPIGGSWNELSWGLRDHFLAVYEHNGMLVATGLDGLIARSIDGVQWWSSTSSTSSHLGSIIHFAGRWIAAGSSMTILSSPDGVSWIPAPVLGSDQFEDLVASPSRAIAVTYNGEIYYSSDGMTWLQADSSVVNTYLQGCGYLPGTNKFVAGGEDGGLYFSDDQGVTWQTSADSQSLTSEWIQSFTVHQGELIGFTTPGTLIHSSNGEDWSVLSPGPQGTYFRGSQLATRNGVLYYLGNYIQPSILVKRGPGLIRDTTALVHTSLDGVNWRLQSGVIHYDRSFGFAWLNDVMVTVGWSGSVHRMTSLSEHFPDWGLRRDVPDFLMMLARCWD